MNHHSAGSAALPLSKFVLPFDVAPHPCNLAFCKVMTAILLKAVGVNLSQVVDGDEFRSIAQEIQNIFTTRFGAAEPRSAPPAQHHMAPELTPEQFTAWLAMLDLPSSDVPCAVARNLDWLSQALHLSSIEKKILLWSYCSHRSVPSVLLGLLSKIPCRSEQQIWHALALFLNEPARGIEQTLAEPCRLHGMSLIDLTHWRDEFVLNRYLVPTPALMDALEIPHRSVDGLLNRLSAPESNFLFDSDTDISPAIVYDMFPKKIAQVYEKTMAKQLLKATDIAALISWFSQHDISEEACAPLNGFLDFATIQRVIRSCFIEHGQSKRPVTQLAVLQAVYAIAK